MTPPPVNKSLKDFDPSFNQRELRINLYRCRSQSCNRSPSCSTFHRIPSYLSTCSADSLEVGNVFVRPHGSLRTRRKHNRLFLRTNAYIAPRRDRELFEYCVHVHMRATISSSRLNILLDKYIILFYRAHTPYRHLPLIFPESRKNK